MEHYEPHCYHAAVEKSCRPQYPNHHHDRTDFCNGVFLPFIHTKLDIVLFNALPFNILKGLIIGSFAMLMYKRLAPVLKGR